MRRKSANLLLLLLGTCLGFVGGILFAPSRGTHVRKTLSYKVRSCMERLQELIRTLSRNKATGSSQAKAAGQEVIEETIVRANKLLKEVNDLAARLEQ